MELLMKWLRGIFKYLYYNKGIYQLKFNRQTLKL